MKDRLRKLGTIACVLATLSVITPSSFSSTAVVAHPDPDKLELVLSDFETYAITAMKDWAVPGMAIVIVRGGEIIYEKAFGVKELGKEDPVTTNTVFQIGSASKAFTSALAAMLVDDGLLAWDDKVINRLNDFRMYDPWVTTQFMVTDLMAQRSGLAAHAIDSLVMVGFDRQRVLDCLRYVRPVTSFRSSYAYQNNLWLAAAKVIEKISGRSWEENIKKRIFEPLDMRSSSCDMESFVHGRDVASLHHDVGGKIVVLPMDWPYMDWVYTYGPAGGINANIKDVSKWLRMQTSGGVYGSMRLIKEESVRFMRAPQTPIPRKTGPNQYYCLGWVHREANPYPITWHNGGTSGSKTMIAFMPEAKLGIAVLSNLVETELPETLAWRFFDSYFGLPWRDWSKEALERNRLEAEKEKAMEPKAPLEPKPAMEFDRYTGVYSNDLYGPAIVEKADMDLILTVGPKKVKIALRHWDSNIFAGSWNYYGVREDAGFVTFTVKGSGRVEGMIVDLLNEDGCGVFRKEPSGLDGHGIPETIISKQSGRERILIHDTKVVRERIAGSKNAPSTEVLSLGSVYDKIYNEARLVKNVREISYDQFMRLRRSGEPFVLVDVLSSDDYGTGHIDGAISIPLKSLSKPIACAKMPAGSKVVVYCLDFHCPSSTEAALKMESYGYRVLDYKGGLDEWQQKGNKLVR